MEDLKKRLADLAKTDIFEVANEIDNFVGYPFYLDYKKANILTCDDWKYKSGGIPQGCLMLAFYKNPFNTVQSDEAILLRAIKPCAIPSDSDLVTSKIEFYKENIDITSAKSKDNTLDDFTRFEFSFSGMECSILGTFYKNTEGNTEFGADVENFFSSHYYKVYKLKGKYLEYVVNRPDDDKPLKPDANFSLGNVRYSSSRNTKGANTDAEKEPSDIHNEETVYIHTNDILGKRTALFGMTRTGKSNTVKKIIEATETLSLKAKLNLDTSEESFEQSAKPFTEEEIPKYPVGQIIFDVNGEYANKNLQDGTAIFEKYNSKTLRYSILKKIEPGFNIMKVNFYKDIETGFEYILNYLEDDNSDYLTGFKVVSFQIPEKDDYNGWKKYNKHKSIYFCCLDKAGFVTNQDISLKISINQQLETLLIEKEADYLAKKIVKKTNSSDLEGLTIQEAYAFWKIIWDNRSDDCFKQIEKANKGKDWLTEEIRSLLVMLFQKKEAGQIVSGFVKFKSALELHDGSLKSSFQKDIWTQLRKGGIVIVDLSQGNPKIQRIFSNDICQYIFKNSMNSFVNAKPNNFIQFYFEEAHNLFPKKDDKDLSQIYNRIAKEGAKLNLGLIYATQEVSSISSNILKNTQNWFIAHLNNEDEIKELRKFYDFSDFADSLIRFSANNDKGFVRMKTYSNPFVVPVQIELFK
jgi:hypothetical protein